MSSSSHDLRRIVLDVDDDGIPGDGDGEFFTPEMWVAYEVFNSLGGNSQAEVKLGRDVPATITVGAYSEGHRVMSAKWQKQQAAAADGPHEGFRGNFRNPQNGEGISSDKLLILQPAAPTVVQGIQMRTWAVSFREATYRPALDIPVGGGSV